jgi:hypothetical protein
MFDFFDDNCIELFPDGETPTRDGDKFSIKAKLNKHLKSKKKVKKSRWLGPSNIWNIDPSEFVYSYFVGFQQEFNFDAKMRMDFGTVAHKTIQDILLGMQAVEKDSIEAFVVDHRNGMAGLIDGIVNPNHLLAAKKQIADDRVVLEIKTCNERIYDSLFFPADISDSYKAQAEVYQKATGINKTLFVFVNSSSYSIKCLFYEYHGEWYNKVCEKADLIWDHIARRELPEYKICTKEKWQELIKDVDVPLNRNDIDYTPKDAKKEEEQAD